MTSTAWIPVEGGADLPPDRLERVLRLGQISVPELTDAEREGPQAYLVAQGSATDPLPVHFHGVDQYQYFAHGSGTVGAHAVGAATLHYSDALTPYGPLRPGPEGMSYLTLRPVHDDQVRYMPGSSSELAALLAGSERPASERRNVAVPVDVPAGSHGWVELHHEPDGLRVCAVRLGPGEEAPALTVGGGGAYALVVRGAVEAPVGAVAEDGLRWLDAGQVLEVRAAGVATIVALAQYPVRLPRPQAPAAGGADGVDDR